MKLEINSQYFKFRPIKTIMLFIRELLFEGRQLPARWIWTNHISSNLLKISFWLPQIKKVHQPIFIIGMGRSGTTILAKVLSSHPDIALLNEPKLLWNIAFPYEDIAGNFVEHIAHYRLGHEHATKQISLAMHRMYGLYLACTGSKRILDKYPELLFRVSFVLSIFPDAKFIFIMRNGVDTIRSVCRWSEKYARVAKNNDTYDWWGVNNRKWRFIVDQLVFQDPFLGEIYDDISNFDRNKDKAATEWIVTMRQGLLLLERMPYNICFLRYEDLTRYPVEELNRIIDFCNLPPCEPLISYATNILTVLPHKPPVDLHSSLQPLFDETMKLTSYNHSL